MCTVTYIYKFTFSALSPGLAVAATAKTTIRAICNKICDSSGHIFKITPVPFAQSGLVNVEVLAILGGGREERRADFNTFDFHSAQLCFVPTIKKLEAE